LREFNTLKLNSRAENFCCITNEAELERVCDFVQKKSLRLNIIGTGSNVILPETLSGLTIKIDIRGIRYGPTEGMVSIGAGENWHGLVLDTINHNFSGLENLSLIPGTVGAAPIQNIGAYGVELSDFFLSLRAIDVSTGDWINFAKSDCKFGYRDSIFRNSSRYVISSVTLKLHSEFNPILNYPGVKEALEFNNIQSPNAQDLSNIISKIRESKLPNPKRLPNVGSFFKNPIISRDKYRELKRDFDNLPCWEQPDGMVKISAANILDSLGCKGYSEGALEVSKSHSLVIVNHGKAVEQDVRNLVGKLKALVYERCGIQLIVEPIFIKSH
tara:strand:+ start:521 stop:1507 length:987 start_codon:yes stop_codon:yes gene_type:complete